MTSTEAGNSSIALNVYLSYTTIMLNIVTIHAMRKTSSLPKPLKTLLLSLAVSDLGVGLLVQPLYIALTVMENEQNTENRKTYNYTLVAYGITAELLCLASFLGVTALTVDRFLAIHLHLRYQELVTHKRVVAAVISIWLFSAFISVLNWWKIKTMTDYTVVITAIVCLISSTLLYCKIYLAVRRHTSQIQAFQVQQQPQNGDMVTNAERQRKSAVATFCVFLAFLICYLPNTCIVAVKMSGRNIALAPILPIFADTIAFFNSSLNPLIYCWRMRHIRHAVMNILRYRHRDHN